MIIYCLITLFIYCFDPFCSLLPWRDGWLRASAERELMRIPRLVALRRFEEKKHPWIQHDTMCSNLIIDLPTNVFCFSTLINIYNLVSPVSCPLSFYFPVPPISLSMFLYFLIYFMCSLLFISQLRLITCLSRYVFFLSVCLSRKSLSTLPISPVLLFAYWFLLLKYDIYEPMCLYLYLLIYQSFFACRLISFSLSLCIKLPIDINICLYVCFIMCVFLVHVDSTGLFACNCFSVNRLKCMVFYHVVLSVERHVPNATSATTFATCKLASALFSKTCAVRNSRNILLCL